MKNLRIIALLVLAAPTVSAMPTSITYQGALKQKGQPATGTHTVSFSVLDNGSVLWAMPNPISVQVVNGLFSVSVTPAIPDWSVLKAPSLRVFIDGEQIGNGNDEPINATVYALVSQSVVDGAVTTQKLAPAVQDHLVPSGAIMMFTKDCPAGWTRFSTLDNQFPMGASTFGTTGGTPVSTLFAFLDGQGPGSSSFLAGHYEPSEGANLAFYPPFVRMIFCQKQ
jgi:hypothetical protein